MSLPFLKIGNYCSCNYFCILQTCSEMDTVTAVILNSVIKKTWYYSYDSQFISLWLWHSVGEECGMPACLANYVVPTVRKNSVKQLVLYIMWHLLRWLEKQQQINLIWLQCFNFKLSRKAYVSSPITNTAKLI